MCPVLDFLQHIEFRKVQQHIFPLSPELPLFPPISIKKNILDIKVNSVWKKECHFCFLSRLARICIDTRFTLITVLITITLGEPNGAWASYPRVQEEGMEGNKPMEPQKKKKSSREETVWGRAEVLDYTLYIIHICTNEKKKKKKKKTERNFFGPL